MSPVSDDGADPITVLRMRQAADRPRVWSYYLCPRSLARKWAEDAARPGSEPGDQAEDLGPDALPMLTQAEQRNRAAYSVDGVTIMRLVGTAKGGKWIKWLLSAPREPVPGSPGQAGVRN